jgi:hypothetical protein
MVPQEHVQQRTKRAGKRQLAKAAREAVQPETPQSSIPQTTRRSRSQVIRDIDLPAVAHCKDLDLLRHLTADEARQHVNRYLHTVMPREQADDFEALTYHWELHLVELDQIQLLRQVDMNRRKLSRYRTALRKGASFPPLMALGGDSTQPTEGVLLCDGYHRAIAMRDIGLHFAWVWLAVGLWREPVGVASDTSMLSSARV